MQPLNLTNLVLQNSYIVIMALGMLMVIVSGHIDLSVGSTAGLVGALAAVLMVQYDVNYIWATIICIATGALIGAACYHTRNFPFYVKISAGHMEPKLSPALP